ncbi:3-(3-hydroxy-phenyl)propionate/3-hydroxycinnamic acid hydroxylase [Corynebacterium occultum]|uniref:3-(3-hydroxy-phenyl)propionate/3-hydroxycinnamic acid hydroxylase n=1 Tax=Corynebacterium occultum TaxID=2675219 RepID=A0A6B8W3Q0_9CORY|nr:bifunctional 3-(3-hydroxy-phenyl)propionate/3-hydroxycinnamic acid hydroxylase [Corynebacterium occultum]QGU06025.1 3-(3-hydroxy-phenyl)propionate/3-hydroxycinnamic acid hydroxylase [Corynebacterium occultum]
MSSQLPDTQDYDYDVVIVGYGPSGVTAANFLGQYGISTGVFERAVDIYSRARAVTMDDYTMRLFQQAGLDHKLMADMDPRSILRWKTYDGHEFLRVSSPDTTYGHPANSQIFQPRVEKTLREGVGRYTDSVDVHFNHEFVDITQDSDGVGLTIRDHTTNTTREVRAKYVLACDGGSSRVRSLLKMELRGKSKPTEWVIVDAKVKSWWPERDLLTFWSDPDRPVVDMPLALGHHRWELPLRSHEKREDFESREALWELLAPFGVTDEQVEILQHAFYTHHVLMADRWRKDRVFLVGDAAHMMPPWAGQGMQSGVRDAHNISWKLRLVLEGRAPDGLLDLYQAEREPHVREMTKLAEMLGFFIEEPNPTKVAIRNRALPVLQKLPGIGPVIKEFRFKPAPTVKKGFINGHVGRGTAVGRMIPQPTVATRNAHQSLLDDFLGDGFAILGFDTDPREKLTDAQITSWETLGATFRTVRSTTHAPHTDDDLIDFTNVLMPWARKHRVSVVVLRPDRFVMATDRTGLDIPRLAGTYVQSPVTAPAA